MKKLITNYLTVFLLIFISISSFALPFSDPFKWNVKLKNDNSLEVSVSMESHYYLYKSETTLIVKNSAHEIIKPNKIPQSKNHFDSLSNTNADVFMDSKVSWKYPIINKNQLPYLISIIYQGCKEKDAKSAAQCFIPSTKNLIIKKDLTITEATDSDLKLFTTKQKATKKETTSHKKITVNEKRQKIVENIKNLLTNFNTAKKGSGVMSKDEMLAFLNISKKTSTTKNTQKTTPITNGGQDNELVTKLKSKSMLAMLILIFLGGLSLNLTPCVLPLIPINLAVIGAGNAAESKFAGLIRGSIYALGIMISYGILGLIAVLAGTPLGSLNSSPWFNFTIMLIFIILGLGMFDVFVIDLSRYGSGLGPKVGEKVGYFWTFFLGVITALLAGACVAPVVIAVLILSADLSQSGSILGFILPFILGLGMAAPWPLAGAGLSVLPKPGAWMNTVKHILGVIIFALAIFYAYEGYKLLPNKEDSITNELVKLENKLKEAKEKNKPVFIDFWATWCKNCLTMNATTFKEKEVENMLKNNFVEIRFQAEKPNQKHIKSTLQLFNVQGMPEYRILTPKINEKESAKEGLSKLFNMTK